MLTECIRGAFVANSAASSDEAAEGASYGRRGRLSEVPPVVREEPMPAAPPAAGHTAALYSLVALVSFAAAAGIVLLR